ncbi:MAG: hypothetical protein NT064_11865 [Proteobacteria bacterium]|nr:hypothetical protein [Pseudomonadota bacterium]
MTTRRQVIAAGMALGVLPGLAGSQSRLSATSPQSLAVSQVLMDERFADAVAMGSYAVAAGRAVTTLPRDVLGLWYDQLLPELRSGRLQTLGGITTPDGLFLVRTLAADFRWRVIYEANHLASSTSVMTHRLHGRWATVSMLAADIQTQDWRQRFASALVGCHVTGRIGTRTVLTPCSTTGLVAQDLVSWVLAPGLRQT